MGVIALLILIVVCAVVVSKLHDSSPDFIQTQETNEKTKSMNSKLDEIMKNQTIHDTLTLNKENKNAANTNSTSDSSTENNKNTTDYNNNNYNSNDDTVNKNNTNNNNNTNNATNNNTSNTITTPNNNNNNNSNSNSGEFNVHISANTAKNQEEIVRYLSRFKPDNIELSYAKTGFYILKFHNKDFENLKTIVNDLIKDKNIIIAAEIFEWDNSAKSYHIRSINPEPITKKE